MKDIKDYLQHLQTCQTLQNWDEAAQALADTPDRFRDEGYYMAVEKLQEQRRVCTCGLDEILRTNTGEGFNK